MGIKLRKKFKYINSKKTYKNTKITKSKNIASYILTFKSVFKYKKKLFFTNLACFSRRLLGKLGLAFGLALILVLLVYFIL